MKIIASKYSIIHLIVIGVLFSSMFFSSGCKSKSNLPKDEREVKFTEPTPEWVTARPHNSAYYIGIGSSSKTAQPFDYQSIAKKNAFNDLASEISVRVQGETFLNSLEVNKNFSEEFISTISTSTDEKIENYEVAGIWENDKEYWTYYRMNKSEFQRLKTEKKNKVLQAANDYLQKGKTAETATNVPLAFEMYMRGLFAMKEYWNEVNEYPTVNGNIILDNELFSSLQQLGNGLQIKSSSSKITLSAQNNYHLNVPITILYNGKPAKGITVAYTYVRAEPAKPKNGITNDLGEISVNISDVNTTEKSNSLALSLNLEPLLLSDLDRSIQSGLIKNIHSDKQQVPIEFITPSFFIQSEELSFGKTNSNKTLATTFSNELSKQGMRIAPSSKDTNYIISIKSNTTDAGSSQGFNVAHLDMQISVANTTNGELIYEESFTGLKGLQLNIIAAGTEAYKKGKEKIEREVIKSLLQNIL